MSNIIPRDPGAQLQAMFGRIVGEKPSNYMSYDAARKHAKVTGAVFRGTGEGAVVGAVMGIVNASRQNGLDVQIGTSKHAAPIDGLAALATGVIAIASAQEDYAQDFVNTAIACSALFTFRKVSDAVTEMNIRKSGATPGGGARVPGKISKASFGAESDGWATGSSGAIDEDPILAAGRRL